MENEKPWPPLGVDYYYSDNYIAIIHGDCREVMAQLEAESITACVTDPPYGLEFMGKEWDRLGKRHTDRNFKGFVLAPSIGRSRNVKCPECEKWVYDHKGRECTCGGWKRSASRGMQSWHQSWAETLLPILKSGAMLLAFGGTRTSHRLACAVEDAGFELRDTLIYMFGSGFPKSLDISKSIDKAVGAEREVKGKRQHPTLKDKSKIEEQANAAHGGNHWAREWDITVPATNAAKLWDGYGTSLKPAYEPILLAMKPLSGTFAANAIEQGVAGINVDGCRIETEDNLDGGAQKLWSHYRDGKESSARKTYENEGSTNFTMKPGPRGGSPQGRWPANLILDEEAAQLLDEQSGEQKSGSRQAGKYVPAGYLYAQTPAEMPALESSTGGASRYFYTTKASSSERGAGNTHPTVKPLALMLWLCKLVMMPENTVILDPFMGSGTTLIACSRLGIKAIGIEQSEEYCKMSRDRIIADAPLFHAN